MFNILEENVMLEPKMDVCIIANQLEGDVLKFFWWFSAELLFDHMLETIKLLTSDIITHKN